jgi:hypothetical protein
MIRSGSLAHHYQRFPFLDQIRRQLSAVAVADVLRRVDCAGWDEQHVAGFQRHRWLAVHLVFQRPFEDIDDFLARVRVLAERYARTEVDANLDDLSPRDAEIVLLEIGTRDSRLLRSRHVTGYVGSEDDCRHRNALRCFHVSPLEYIKSDV